MFVPLLIPALFFFLRALSGSLIGAFFFAFRWTLLRVSTGSLLSLSVSCGWRRRTGKRVCCVLHLWTGCCPTTSASVLPGVTQVFLLNQMKFSSPQHEASARDGFTRFTPTVGKRKMTSVHLKQPLWALAFIYLVVQPLSETTKITNASAQSHACMFLLLKRSGMKILVQRDWKIPPSVPVTDWSWDWSNHPPTRPSTSLLLGLKKPSTSPNTRLELGYMAGWTLPMAHLHRGSKSIVMRSLSSVRQGFILV